MPRHDHRTQRLFVHAPLSRGAVLALDAAQTNYVVNVLRLKSGARLLTFNGVDGEWAASLTDVSRKTCTLTLLEHARPQIGGPDIDYVFAPLKRGRLDYMVQKATEMGVARLRPILTDHTQSERVKLERMRANCVEAAEQCGVLRVPTVAEPITFATWLRHAGGQPERHIIFCDEAADVADPVAALSALPHGPVAVVVGPEGGFSESERDGLSRLGHACRIALGPRIMRADTAAVAALTLVNATLGDWG
ncbi:MAG: 16S rRNA (uracil(1498)-N(3))-methyltransferase [Pseudomonadota bacterium]